MRKNEFRLLCFCSSAVYVERSAVVANSLAQNPDNRGTAWAVVVVDDSIVRGTTARALVKLLYSAGAKSVHVRISSPPVTDPCYYGMDFPSREELFANKHNGDVEAMRKWLQVDSLGYLSPEGLVEAATRSSQSKHSFCRACFTGVYPVPIEPSKDDTSNDW